MLHLKKTATQDLPVYDRILSTALDLFVERGYHNVSIHDIQKMANVSIGSIYNHFGGKEGVAKALYYHLIREMEELVADVIDENLSFRESCNRIISLLFEYTESKRNIVAYVLHAKHQEFLPDEPPICSSTPFKTMRNIVQRGMESGEIRDGDPWVVASGVFGGAIRLIHLRLDGVLNVPLPELYDELIDCMWHGMEPISIEENVA
ncbi:MAG: TetR/AcrR family transcriptional regulator [Candidatus Thiodiazotropha taylori]|uniref:TetR/AcrR family transcriptional regulator n=1 Tax=Candidatus Thiodiazotropha taylori TaxID=2792791 RepID=A0A9E4KAV2_9GAMM|nr:TetR/AcrR family transcriptional regulator [Candidatus Thiodiazotropha taylori]MCG7965330.1 TetR/AcrR family transcriptional regulator [Candidatus Thiodiazotropha taylori]MCG8052156.1 TetR/AcrR family transcriptional regulator [Candidatus Thiodiazotropha taylori]MCW4256145.1 TetR/AcrR family transcriptional regulator [Candidatus Thiodiazotropha taylori]MCW4313978.1 TetR/AcrR family transcriptional regulator [Candidatus Thiodiazotropha taylori]